MASSGQGACLAPEWLREAFRADDIAARVGRVFERYNEGSGKPYRHGCSIGGHG